MVKRYDARITDRNFSDIGLELMGKPKTYRSRKARDRRFKAWFGLTPQWCAIVWFELQSSGWLDRAPRVHVYPRHLLYALHFLKNYETEQANALKVFCDDKTFRQWSWYFIEGIASLESKFVSLFCLLSFYISCM